MSLLTLHTGTKEYVFFPVKATEQDGDTIDLSADTVQVAFTDPGTEPVAGDWVSAAWEAGGPDPSGFYRAFLLVGGVGSGAAKELADGVWQAWVRVTDSPERPVRPVGQVSIR